MSLHLDFHDVVFADLSQPRDFTSQGDVCWVRRLVITDGTGHEQQINLFADSREALHTSIDKPLDAAQTAAYAEGRKDEREEWEALRAQMLEALQEVLPMCEEDWQGHSPDTNGSKCIRRMRAAIAAATGEQQP